MTLQACLFRSAFVSAALALWAALAGAQTAVAPSGAGTEESPYQIMQLGNLVWMRATVSQSSNAVYRLMNDIDASETAGWNGGNGFLPIGGPWSGGAAFKGAFDGGGHAIRGLVVGGEGLELGLFGVTGTGSAVKNLALVGASVAGSLYNGGIAGVNDGGRISDCFVEAAIQGPGGCVVGENWAGTIERCYATGTVEAPDSTVGGIADYCMDGTVTQCYASVCLKGLMAGGLVRESPYGGSHSEVASSYWDLEASGVASSSGGGEGKSAAQMRQQATFEGWDFENVWGIIEGESTPYLRRFPPPFTLNVTTQGAGRIEIAPRKAAYQPGERVTPFMLNVQVLGEGAVTAHPQKSAYCPGERVTLTATPAGGQRVFVKWNGAVADQDNPVTTVTMDTHRTVTACFSDPVTEIGTLDELRLIGNDPACPLAGSYRLTQDLDAAAATNWNGGAGFLPIASAAEFGGVFDGHGHTIFNLAVDQPQSHEVGLFARIGPGGVVRNLRLAGAAVRGHTAVGCIAGLNQGRVARCEVSGVVTGCLHVGAVVGASRFGVVSGCAAAACVAGDSRVGGIAGVVDHGWVSRCYAAGALSSGGPLGGISHADAQEVFGTITKSYWDVEASGCATSAGGEGKTTAEMRRQATFEDWDFTAEWGLDEDAGLPFLWQFRLALPPGLGAEDGTNRPAYAAWAAAHTNAWGTADFSGVPPADFEAAWLLNQQPAAGFAAATDLKVCAFTVGAEEIGVGLALAAEGLAKQGGVNGWLVVEGKAAPGDAWRVAAAQQDCDGRITFADGAATVAFARPEGCRFFRPALRPACAASGLPLRQVAAP